VSISFSFASKSLLAMFKAPNIFERLIDPARSQRASGNFGGDHTFA